MVFKDFSYALLLNLAILPFIFGDKICWEDGQCEGSFVDLTISNTKEECFDFCSANPNCNFFTFDVEDKSCTLFGDRALDLSCISCVSAEKDCPLLSKFK